jgi:AcrR family transcriptional regulator
MMSQHRNSALAPTAANAIDDDLILDAAYQLFLSVGPRRLTMADVARHTEVSRATLYRRWPNVRSLIGAIVTREWSTLAAATFRPGDGPARAELVCAVVAMVGAIRAHPVLRGIVERDPEFLLPYVLQRRGSSTELQLNTLETAIRAGQSDGSVRPGRPELLAEAVLLASMSFVLSARAITRDRAPDHARGAARNNASSASRVGATDDLDAELAALIDRYLAP